MTLDVAKLCRQLSQDQREDCRREVAAWKKDIGGKTNDMMVYNWGTKSRWRYKRGGTEEKWGEKRGDGEKEQSWR